MKLVKNAKINGNEECIPQHNLVVAVFKIQTPSQKPCFIAAKSKSWRLHAPKVKTEYQNFIKDHCADVTPSCVEDPWKNLKDCLFSGVDNETWWQNNAVNNVVKENQHKWMLWKLGRSKEKCQSAKKAASHPVYDAKQQTQSEYFSDINTNNDPNKTFKMACTIKDTNKDVTKKSVYVMVRGV